MFFFPGEDPFYSAAQVFLFLGGVWTQVLFILGTAYHPGRWLCPNHGTCVVLGNRVNENTLSWVGGSSSLYLRPLKWSMFTASGRRNDDTGQTWLTTASTENRENNSRVRTNATSRTWKVEENAFLPRVLGKEYLTLALRSQEKILMYLHSSKPLNS